jgi:hypothetical protein
MFTTADERTTPQLCSRYNPVTQEINGDLANPTCLMDVILLPLPAVILAISLLFSMKYRHEAATTLTTSEKGQLLPLRTGKFKIILHYLDIALAFCEGGMQVLEIARLAISNEGVGLLPSTFVDL